VAAFRLEADRWRAVLPRPLRCVLTSLVVHHLAAGQKRRLFAGLPALRPGQQLVAVRYFTSRVSYSPSDPNQPARSAEGNPDPAG
jgi:hypothetical protein